MGESSEKGGIGSLSINGVSAVSSSRLLRKSKIIRPGMQRGKNVGVRSVESSVEDMQQESNTVIPILSEKRKALFEPLEPATNVNNGKSMSAESLLPPPDFDSASYPRGWLIGKKRKLVNVDVVESMRRIAILEMNRKDREINGLNEQLEEDGRCLEHLQLQLVEERRKRAEVERENTVLQNQVTMLMEMIEENEAIDYQEL